MTGECDIWLDEAPVLDAGDFVGHRFECWLGGSPVISGDPFGSGSPRRRASVILIV